MISTPNLFFSLATALQMLGAQAADDLLLGLGVDDEGNGGILFDQAGQRAGDLALVALLGNPDSHAVAGLGYTGAGSVTTRAGSHRVSPVLAVASFGNCADITGPDGGVSVCFLPQTVSVLPRRSGWPVRALMTLLVAVSLPDST